MRRGCSKWKTSLEAARDGPVRSHPRLPSGEGHSEIRSSRKANLRRLEMGTTVRNFEYRNRIEVVAAEIDVDSVAQSDAKGAF